MRVQVGGMVAALATVLLAGCLAPASQPLAPLGVGALPDVVAAGLRQVTRLEYDFGPTVVTDEPNGRAYVAPLRGSLRIPEGDGPFPVVLFQHGRHDVCEGLADRWVYGSGPFLCPRAPPVSEPVDSYTGYDTLAENLASHGYVVGSVDANTINARDGDTYASEFAYGVETDHGIVARAQLLLRTLDRLAELNADGGSDPLGQALAGRLDMGRVGLMGHSRGGEGVTRAITYNEERTDGPRHALKAVFALAPSDFNLLEAPGVAYATLLPYCDGDVWFQWGANILDDSRYLGDAAPKIQLLAMGQNHNFYNTVWTEDDAVYSATKADDPACGTEGRLYGASPHRLAPEDQLRVGDAYMGAFFRLYLGGERVLLPLFTGQAGVPSEACPQTPACEGLVRASYFAPAGERHVLAALDDLAPVVLDGFEAARVCAPADCAGGRTLGNASRLEVAWAGPASLRVDLAEPLDARPFDALTFRAAVDDGQPQNPRATAQDVRVLLTDAAGRSASANAWPHGHGLLPAPGIAARQPLLEQVTLPLGLFPGIDLGQLRSVTLVFDRTPTGMMQLADLQMQRLAGPALPPPAPAKGPLPPSPLQGTCEVGALGAKVPLLGQSAGFLFTACPFSSMVPERLDRAREVEVEASWERLSPTIADVRLLVGPPGCTAQACAVASASGLQTPLRVSLAPDVRAAHADTGLWASVDFDGVADDFFQLKLTMRE